MTSGVSCLPLSRGRSFYQMPADRARTQRDQLAVILSVVGTPSKADIHKARTDEARTYLTQAAQLDPHSRIDWSDKSVTLHTLSLLLC